MVLRCGRRRNGFSFDLQDFYIPLFLPPPLPYKLQPPTTPLPSLPNCTKLLQPLFSSHSPPLHLRIAHKKKFLFMLLDSYFAEDGERAFLYSNEPISRLKKPCHVLDILTGYSLSHMFQRYADFGCCRSGLPKHAISDFSPSVPILWTIIALSIYPCLKSLLAVLQVCMRVRIFCLAFEQALSWAEDEILCRTNGVYP